MSQSYPLLPRATSLLAAAALLSLAACAKKQPPLLLLSRQITRKHASKP